MTLIGVFSDSKATHLISDSLITHSVENAGEFLNSEWLSTGIFLENKGEIRYKYSEGLLKIWPIQPNLAIGLSGDIPLATSILEMIVDHCKIERLRSYRDLDQLLQGRVISSISPFNGSCVLCGYIENDGRATKFKITFGETSNLTIENTTDPMEIYCTGSGEQEFLDILRRLRTDYMRPDIDPTLLFSVFAEHIYLKQFLEGSELIVNTFIGGAILGVCCIDNKTTWQPSRSIIVFVNKGGTGFKASFQWQNWIYKTWSEDNRVFSSSMIEQNGHYYQRITQYSNQLSPAIHVAPESLTDEMKTFNAQQVSAILLPKGLIKEFPAMLRVSGKFRAFDEIQESGRIAGIRLNQEFIKRLTREFFVCNDYTIRIGFERLPPLIDALRKQLKSSLKTQDPSKWAQLQGNLATTLIEYGGNTNNLDLLKEALSRLMDAYETAIRNNLDLVSDIKHDIKQFVQDMNKNLNKEQIDAIIQGHEQALERIIYKKPVIKL